MEQKVSEILPLLLHHGNRLMWETLRTRSCCVASTAIGLMALRRLGVQDTTELSVEARAANPQAMQALERGDKLWMHAPGARVLLAGSPLNVPAHRGAWAGHLVILVEDTLLDLTADQLSRPEDHMPIAPIMMQLEESFLVGLDYQLYQPGGPGTAAVGYRWTPLNVGYAEFGDWTRAHEHAYLADELVSRIRYDLQRRGCRTDSEALVAGKRC